MENTQPSLLDGKRMILNKAEHCVEREKYLLWRNPAFRFAKEIGFWIKIFS